MAEMNRPNASFMFTPKEWICSTTGLSLAEQGRLITRIFRAVQERDVAFLAQHSSYVGRVYWREKIQRAYLPPSVRRAVMERDGRACVLCGSDYKIEIDHIIPWSKGGLHTIDNLRVLCKKCNRKKGAK